MEREERARPRERPGPPPRPASVGSAGTGTLERKSKDLNKATRELEAKVKNLQQKTRSLPRCATSRPQSRTRELPRAPSAGKEEREEKAGEKKKGSTVTSRVREREAEFQKQVTDRDEQIGRLKERLKLLSSRLHDTKEKELKPGQKPRDREKQVQGILDEGTELQNIIRQVTKERLQLERHLQIANDSLQRNNGVDLHKYLSLETTNSHLRQQLDSLDILQQEYKVVEIQHREKEEACKELLNTLKYKSSLVEDLEAQLAKVIEKNTELTIQNSDLQKKVVELKEVTDECEQLKNTLTEVETECTVAKSEVVNLSGKVRNLECVLQEMHKAAENRREIERQHREALESLKRKQGEVEVVATKKQTEIIDQMKEKIAELEVERKVLNEKHQELILEMADLKRYGRDSLPAEMENPSDNIEIDQIMAKLEQDNKFLADLEKQRADRSKGESPPHRAGSAITDSGFLSQSSLTGASVSPVTRERAASLHRSALELPGLTGADKINLLSGSFSTSALNSLPGHTLLGHTGQEVIVDKDGMVEIPGKGWCWVYLARYSYDPFQHSPNDTPEAELAINAGDYILVWSHPDQDGFFDGEILDGRKGLVPSNFVERLEGEHLVDFYKSVFLGIGDGDDSVCTSIAQDLDFISSDEGAEESQAKYFTSRRATLSHYASCTDLDITEDEGDGQEAEHAAAPKHLTLETQLNKSFVIGWSPPTNQPSSLDSYQVMVDGEVKEEVKATEKALKAVAHGYDFGKVHRISVKTVSASRKSSAEAACTMVVGKDAPLGPTALRATRIRATSASITWMPSNTNFLHTLLLNNVEVRTVKQGVFKHTIAGLAPNTTYKVTVRAKNIKAAPYVMDRNVSQQIDTLSSHLELRTLPQGLPDAPLDVQVEAGPRPGTLSVLWLPVTIIDRGLSNGAPVTGYTVYGDGRRLQEVEDSTADSAVIVADKLGFKTVTVRTKSHDKHSGDSSPATVPEELQVAAEVVRVEERLDKRVAGKVEEKAEERVGSSSPDSDTELMEKLHTHSIINGVARSRELIINYSGFPEPGDSDLGPSELSDIAEEPEDELTDSEDSRSSTTPRLPEGRAGALAGKPCWREGGSSQAPPGATKSLPTNQVTTNNNNLANNNSVRCTEQPPGPRPPGGALVTNNRNSAERMRIFVALFDYDPPTMSPNPDACDEELPFREGQLIKVFGEKDGDGFYWGEAGTRAGFVPCNMVSEVQVDDERVAEELFREEAGGAGGAAASTAGSAAAKERGASGEREERWGDIYEDSPMKRKIALYDYDPTELSPNVDSEVELTFRTGDLVTIYGDMDDDGFYMGEVRGQRGLVPSNFLTEVPVGLEGREAKAFHHLQPRVLGQQRVAATGGRW